MEAPNISLPAVLRSRQQLREETGAVPTEALPITPSGVTYSMAQEAAWIDQRHFAVGRWDGTLSVFCFTEAADSGPLIAHAVNSPAAEGIQMITWLAPCVFATSNDESSMIVWTSRAGSWGDLTRRAVLPYDAAYGVANSGDAYTVGGRLWFVAGHANGFITLWTGTGDASKITFVAAVDLRTTRPVNPWGLQNIRGVSAVTWDARVGYVATGSENGELCVVRLPDGLVLSRTLFNPEAKRGINNIAAFGRHLLAANCSVGPSDKNLWYYWIDSSDWGLRLRDAVNLRSVSDAPQIFNFSVVWAQYDGGVCFFCSTEEGILWMGTVAGQRLSILGYEQVTTHLGAALAFSVAGDLVVVGHDLHEFKTLTAPAPWVHGQHPERLPIPVS